MTKQDLTAREKELLNEIRDCQENLEAYDGKTLNQLENDNYFPDYLEKLDDFCVKAIRAELHIHPSVPQKVKDFLVNWLQTRADLNQKDLLRQIRKGLEKNIKRPYQEHELKIMGRYIDLKESGRNDSEIYRALTKEDLIGRMSRQAFLKMLERLLK